MPETLLALPPRALPPPASGALPPAASGALPPAASGALPPLVSGALPLVGHAPQFLRDQLRLLERGYQEHGEIFRLRLRPGRRPAIFLVGPERARWVFKQTDDQTLSIGASLAFTRRLFGPDFYFLAEPAEYQHQRETLLPLLRARMAAGYLAIMDRHCARLVARLGDSGTFDLPQEMNALVLGIIHYRSRARSASLPLSA